MDDGDLDFSNPDTYLCPALGTDPPSSCSMDSYFDEILKDTEHHACTHTHTCNPPVHDLSHTHTCVHVHTKIVAASPGDDTADSPSENNTNGSGGNGSNAASKKRPSGNRAAVRKYREKKKAHTASLEEEVVHLRALNQQLVKKLQSHAALEAEVARLRCLLVDIRGRIEGEIGAFPYQRPPPAAKNVDLVSGVDQGGFLAGAAAQVTSSCDFRCNDQMYCSPGMQGAVSGQVLGQGACDVSSIQCVGSTRSASTKLPVCGGMDAHAVPAACLPNVQNK
jgi:hypothetical protein